jgi:uncharacterized protein YjbI with pentapeptide repeats
MEVIKRNWLKIAEYLSLAGATIAAIAAIFFEAVIYAGVLLFLSLWLNLMIRYRWHQLQQEEMIHATMTLENLLLDLRINIAERVEQMKTEIAQVHKVAENHASHEDIDNLIMAIEQVQGELSILDDSVIPVRQQLETLISKVQDYSVAPQRLEDWQIQLTEILNRLETRSLSQAALAEIQRFYREIAYSINELKQIKAIAPTFPTASTTDSWQSELSAPSEPAEFTDTLETSETSAEFTDTLEPAEPLEFSTLTAAVTNADRENWGTAEPFAEPVTSFVGQFHHGDRFIESPLQTWQTADDPADRYHQIQPTDSDIPTPHLSDRSASDLPESAAWNQARPQNHWGTAPIVSQSAPETETPSESLAITQRQPNSELQIQQAIPPNNALANHPPQPIWQTYAPPDPQSFAPSGFNDGFNNGFNDPLAVMMHDNTPHLDLSYTNLSGVSLTGANLAGATLTQANLSGTDLSGADLRGADLRGADLSGANLDRADLEGANLAGANLTAVDLRTADLRGANLCEANLAGQNLCGLNLCYINFNGANLEATHLIAANLAGSQLIAANLTYANLTEANLEFANLTDANLTGANIDRANFGAADRQAILTKTVMPDGTAHD